MAKRTPEELWKKLVDEAGEEEIERAASISVAQAEKELAEAGFDVATERAKAEAFLRELEGYPRAKDAKPERSTPPAEPAKPERSTPPAEPAKPTASQHDAEASGLRVRWRRPARISALAAAALAVFWAGMNGRALAAWIQGEPIRPGDVWLPWKPARTPWQRAVLLRMEALDACAQQDWTTCRHKLDEASILDPAGEDSPSVRDARRRIESAEQQQDLDIDGGRRDKPKLP
jgi:hypothetical protein